MPDELFTGRNIVLAQLEVRPAETFSVISRARKGGSITILNASPAASVSLDVLQNATYLIMNHVEAGQLAHGLGIGDAQPRDLALQIAAKTGQTCIITVEDKGCFAARNGQLWHQEALAVEVVDTTGAGDAFCGIFAACLLAGKSWLEALHRASCGASLSCLGLGAQAGMPFMEDIEAALARVAEPAAIQA
jgi:ribokinase